MLWLLHRTAADSDRCDVECAGCDRLEALAGDVSVEYQDSRSQGDLAKYLLEPIAAHEENIRKYSGLSIGSSGATAEKQRHPRDLATPSDGNATTPSTQAMAPSTTIAAKWADIITANIRTGFG